MDIRTIYESLNDDHDEFMFCAEEAARHTIPSLKPRGTWPGTGSSSGGTGQNAKPEILPSAYTGVQAVRSLSSTIMDAMLPDGVKSLRLDLPVSVWANMQTKASEIGADANAIKKDLESRLRRRASEALASIRQKNAPSLLGSAVRRNLVEGVNGIINLRRTIDVFPLRSIRLRRVAGRVAMAVFEEELDTDVLADGYVNSEPQCRYTLIQYPSIDGKTDGAVWVQEPDQDSAVEDTERQWHQFIVFTGEVPDIGDLSVGYAFNFLKLIKNLDHAEQSLNEAMAIAAMNFPMAAPGTVLAEQIDDLNKKRPGEWSIAEPESAWWFTSQQKIGDWSMVAQIASRYDQKLAQAFAMGIKDRNLSPDTPATAVIEIVKELNRQTQDLLRSYEETLIQPLFRSELAFLEAESPLYPEDLTLSAAINAAAEVVITTGVSAISSQRALMQFSLQILPAVMQLDQRVRAEGGRLLEIITDTLQVDRVDQTYRIASPEEMQQMGGGGMGIELAPEPGEHMMTRGGPQRRGGDAQPQTTPQ